MADRKLQYIIEMIADDNSLRKQMKGWNWEDIMGQSKGKSFKDVLVKDTKEAKQEIVNTLSGMGLDWGKILGEKEFAVLEKKIGHVIKSNKDKLAVFANEGDTAGIQKTIDLVSALGNELKGLGSNFDASGIARNITAFMKVLTPISAKMEQLAKEPKKVSDAFDRIFSGNIVDETIRVSQGFTVIGDEAGKAAVKTNQAIKEIEGHLASIDHLFNKEYSIKFSSDLEEQFYTIDEQIEKVEKDIAKFEKKFNNMSSSDKDFESTRNQLMQKYVEQSKLYRQLELVDDKYVSKTSKDDSLLTLNNIIPKDVINAARDRIAVLLNDAKLQLEDVSKSTKTTKDGINIPIKLPTQDDLVKTINQYVDGINKSKAIHSIKLDVDKDIYNPIEDQTKRAYKDNPADDDANTTKIVEQTENRFERIANAIEGKQSKILNDTKIWRKNMLDQFKFKSGDFEFTFNDNLIESLQSLFDDYSLKVNIDPQHLADQIKAVLDSSGGAIGGGTASIDANSMASAIATGLRAVLTGEIPPIVAGGDDSNVSEDMSRQVNHIATEIEQTGKHLDLAEDYVKDVVEKLKAVAKYASKDSKGSIATRNRFDALGIDLYQVKNASDVGNDAEIVSMIESSFLQRDEFGKLKGSTVIDELSKFKDTSSKTIPAFLTSMDEVFFMLQEDTQTVEEWTRKRHDREIFDSAQEKAKAAGALRDIRSPIRQGDIPSIQSIENAISLMTAIGKNTDDLQVLKTTREALADKTDDASIEEFKTAANDFYKSSTKTFFDLKKQSEDMFKGTVYFQGKNGKTYSKYMDSYKQVANIKDDAVIVDVEVSSSLNNVALGTVKSKYNNRTSQSEEKRLMRDATRPDFIIPRQYEADILNKPLTYKGFKPQGVSAQVDLDTSLEVNKKRKQALIEEIQAKEEEKKLLDTEISVLDKKIEDLNAKNQAISQKRRDSAKEKVSDFEATQQQLSNEIFMLEEKVGNGKTGEEQRIGSLTKSIEEQLKKRAYAEKQLAQLSELDVERKKKELAIKVSELETELPTLQESLTKAQARYSIAESDKVMAQVDVNKASAALKAIPNTKKNEAVRVEAENTFNKARFALADATEKVNEASRDVDSATKLIESNERQILNLKTQISETTLNSVREEQLNRIRAINDVITSLENEFQTLMTQKNAKESSLIQINKELEKSRNVVALRTERELDSAISERDKFKRQQIVADNVIKNDQSTIESLEQTNKRVEAEKEYNKLLEKSLMLQGSIEKMTADGDDEKALKKKQKELDKVNAKLAEAKAKVDALGGFLGQGNGKEYSDNERKTYALNELKKIEDDLITARAQKRVSESRISKKDREIADLDKWGLGAGIGASELGRTKGRLTSEFMSGDYVQSQVNALREKTKVAIAEAENRSREIFDKKVAMAMEHLNWNPLDQTQVQKFLNTKHGQQLSSDFTSEVDTNTTNLWKQYDEYRKDLLAKLKAEFQDSFKTDKGVLTATSKMQDETGQWINEIIEVHVKEALKARLEEEKRILETKNEPIQANIDRLEVDRATAIEYGGVSDSELLSGKIIEDQIRKEERLEKLKEKRAEIQQKLNDLENAGVDRSDDAYKSTKKDLNSFDKEIARYEMLVKNRQKLVQMRYDESKEPTYTDEEKELHFTNQIVSYNEKIENSLTKQKSLKEQIASATGDDKTKFERQLSIEEANVAKWREKIPTYESKLNKLQTSKSQGAIGGILPEGGIVGSIVSAVSEVIGNIGTGVEINTEELAKEATLRAILEVLGGVPQNADDSYGLGRGKKDLGHQEAKMIEAISRDPKRMAEIEAHIEEDLKKYSDRQDEQVADPKSYADIQNLVKQYVAAYVGSLSATNLAEGIDKSSDIELTIANKLQSVIGDKFDVDKLLEEVALGSKTEDKAISEIAKAYGFKKPRQKKVEAPIEPVIQPGAVAEEVKENTTETPVKVDVVPTTDDPKATYKSWNVKPQDLDFDTVKTKAVALKQVIDTLYDEGKSDTQEFINAQTELSKLLSSWRNKIGKTTNPELYGKTGKENWMSYLTSGDTKIFDNLDNVELSSISQADYLSRLKKIGIKPTIAKPEIKETEATLQIKDFNEFKLQAQALKQAIEAQNAGSEEQKKIQTALVQVLQAWARNEASGFGGKLPNAEQWATYLTETGVFDKVDTSITPLTNRQLNKDTRAKDVVVDKPAKQEKVERKETKSAKKTETRTQSRQSASQQATGGLIQLVSRLAREDTLIQVLNALRTVGTTANGQTAPTAAGDLYNQFKALLLGGSIDDHERLAYMNSETGAISGNVIGNIANISEELIRALRAKYPTAQGFDTQVHTHGKSSKPYFSTEDYNHFTKDYESGIKKQVLLTKDHISVLDLSAVKSAEEVQALMDELIKAGNNAKSIKKVFENNKSGALFESAKFDSLNADSLVKMLGAKGVNSSRTSGKTYAGNTVVNSVNNQRNKIVGMFDTEKDFNASDIGLVQQYNKAVQDLNTTYQTLAKNQQLQDEQQQKALSQQASRVQALGKHLMSSINQSRQLQQYVDQTGTYMKNGVAEELGGKSGTLSVDEIQNLEATMRNYVQNTLGQANIEHVKFNSTKQQLIYTFRTSKDTVADMVVQYNDATKALYAYNKQERESLTGFAGFIQNIKSKTKSILQYTASMTSIYRVWGTIRQGIQYIREIDSALTELKKVTDATEETYDKFLDTAAKTADKVGSTIKDVVSSTADWARLGYSIQEAATLAESTQVLMNVSEFTDISTATDSLISSIQAFKYTAEESMDVVDILNTIGKQICRGYIVIYNRADNYNG